MEIRRMDFRSIPDLKPAVLAIGFFDGMHLGHRKLLEEARDIGREAGLPWGVLTFDPDPWQLFYPDACLDHLYSLEDREAMARHMGADVFYILHFTKDFASLQPEAFHQLLEKMQCKALVCGFDFRYGGKNAGTVETLKQAPFPVRVVESIQDGEGKISSTRIEQAVRSGNTELAAKMLGQWYSIPGTIVKGYRRGTSLLSFPTANLEPAGMPVLPAQGVYAGWCQAASVFYPCMINVGKNPTFGNGKTSIEAHLFDFAGGLYGQTVRFWFGPRIRDEQKFPDASALRSQLEQDEKRVRSLLKELDLPVAL